MKDLPLPDQKFILIKPLSEAAVYTCLGRYVSKPGCVLAQRRDGRAEVLDLSEGWRSPAIWEGQCL